MVDEKSSQCFRFIADARCVHAAFTAQGAQYIALKRPLSPSAMYRDRSNAVPYWGIFNEDGRIFRR
jgi:hypothetical protein